MLKNDEVFWKPSEEVNAARLSWGGSGGDFEVLWSHTQRRWGYLLNSLKMAGVSPPSGKIIEFGSGLGLLNDVLDDTTSSIVMLDHTDAYLAQRPHPLPSRCRHVLWSADNLDALQREPADYDWLISIAVFYHVDDATAVALITQLGQLLKPGGHVLIEGFRPATPDFLLEVGGKERLFSHYPEYGLSADLMQGALAPAYRELWRDGILLYEKVE